MTGQYPLTHGVYINDVELEPSGQTLGEVFKEAGYRTGYIGKWHLYGSPDGHYGRREDPVPVTHRMGFDYWKAAEFVAKHGAVFVVRGKPAREGEQGPAIGFRPYPQMAIKIALASELLRLEREFGLTPSARARVEVEAPEPAEPAFHYFDATEVG